MTTVAQNSKTIHAMQQAINKLGFTDIYTKNGVSTEHDCFIINLNIHQLNELCQIIKVLKTF